MEKAKVTKEQSNFLDDKLAYFSPSEIVYGFANPSSEIVTSIFISHFDLDTLIRALYIGYEIEKTPEEKVLNFYNAHCNKGIGNSYANGVLNGIEDTLNFLNIKIEGVNA